MPTVICVKTTCSDAINTTLTYFYLEGSKKHLQFSLKHSNGNNCNLENILLCFLNNQNAMDQQ